MLYVPYMVFWVVLVKVWGFVSDLELEPIDAQFVTRWTLPSMTRVKQLTDSIDMIE